MTATVEQAIGRQLREAERIIDVARLDRALARAKDDLDKAIHQETVQAVESWLRVGGLRPLLHVTDKILEPLERLHRIGRREARRELARLGVDIPRRFQIEERPEGWADIVGYLARNLTAISIRISQDHTTADLSDLGHDAVAQALLRIPGGRDIASRIVSTALYAGMGETWETLPETAVGGWERTAILDAGTCPPCKKEDGRRYKTWHEAMVDMPNGGPARNCRGAGRCRCRLVPLPPSNG